MIAIFISKNFSRYHHEYVASLVYPKRISQQQDAIYHGFALRDDENRLIVLRWLRKRIM